MHSRSSSSSAPRASEGAAIGDALWDSAEFERSRRAYEGALAADPSDLAARIGFGRVRLIQNDLAGAIALLESAEEELGARTAPGELARRVARELGWAYYRLGRLDLAARALERAGESGERVAQLDDFGSRTPYAGADEIDEVEIPFLGTNPLPVLAATAAGIEGAFVVDTGSDQVVIDRALVDSGALPDLGSREAIYADGSRAMITATRLPTLEVGGLVLRDVPAEAIELQRRAPQIAGLLGSSLLQRFHVLFDWIGESLWLCARTREGFAPPDGATVVPFWLVDGHLMVAPGAIATHETLLFVTSGLAGAAFGIPSSTRERAGLRDGSTAIEGVGAGGSAIVAELPATNVSLGEWVRPDCVGVEGLFPDELEWRYGFRIGGIVGPEVFRGSRWGLDFTRMEMWLT